MTTPAPKPLRIFCSYSHKDEEHLNDLRDWLRGLERQGLIAWWHDREISPGWEWDEAIDKNLRTADIILLLVSPAFMASDYVYEQEIGKAVERHDRGEARVIPIIVRPSYWEWTSFGKLQALPKDARPITRWPDRDEAWLDVLEGVRKAVAELLVEHQQRAAAKERYRKAVEEAWADNKVSDAEAERLAALASELSLSTDTTVEIERDVLGDTKEAILERQEQAFREKERQDRLDELYARARRSHQNQEWRAVVDIFEQIHAEDQDYPDPTGLLASAREALEAQERERRVATLYDRGQRHIDAEEWQQARECLEEVQRQQPGYRGTEELLSRVRQELASPPTVEVPDLTGQRTPQARSTLSQKGLRLGAQNEVSSDTMPEGQIIEQSPEAGTEVEAYSSVSVTISLGSPTATTADSLGQGVTQPKHAEPVPSGHQPGQRDSGPERVGPDYSTDTQPQPPLRMLDRNWWALALSGLTMVILGLGVSLTLSSDGGVFVRLLTSSLLLANGVFTIVASSTAHPRLLLRAQAMISALAGLVALLSGAIGTPYAPSTFMDALQNMPFLVVHFSTFDLWVICIGIIQIIAAIRLGWDFRVMRLMVVSGALLLVYGIYGFSLLFRWTTGPTPWLLGIWLLASGILLVAFAFRVRRWEDGEVGA
jgi:uncharacterized membrane protein HdeD (DUF308 family)